MPTYQLYHIAGIPPHASDVAIKIAHKKGLLRTHPDHGGNAQDFVLLSEAFQILRDPEARARYDETGDEGLSTPLPRMDENNEEKIIKAKKDFGDFWSKGVKVINSHIDDLLEWWGLPSTLDLSPSESLQTGTDDFFANLTALYHVFRLTHEKTSHRDQAASRKASQAILSLAEREFGAANAKRLREWNTNSPLDPVMGGKYVKKDGNYAEPVALLSNKPWFAEDIEAIHMLSFPDFERLLNPTSAGEDEVIQRLNDSHKIRYRDQMQHVASSLVTSPNSQEKDAFKQLDVDIDWNDVNTTLKGLSSAKQDYTQQSIAKNAWVTMTKKLAFPDHWGSLAIEKLVPTQQRSVQSQWASVTPFEEDAPMEDAPTSLQVNYQGEKRELFAWRYLRQSPQFFIKAPTMSEISFYDVVSARAFRGTLIQALKRKDLDFNTMRGDRAFLEDKDFADLRLVGIAMARRPFHTPPGGFSSLPHIYIFVQHETSDTKAFPRSELGAVYGRDYVDEILATQCGLAGRPMLEGPMRKTLAIAYEAEHDDDTDSDYEETTLEAPSQGVLKEIEPTQAQVVRAARHYGKAYRPTPAKRVPRLTAPAPPLQQQQPQPQNQVLQQEKARLLLNDPSMMNAVLQALGEMAVSGTANDTRSRA